MANQEFNPRPGDDPKIFFDERGATPPIVSPGLIILIVAILLLVLAGLTWALLTKDPALWNCVSILKWMFSREI